MPSLAGRETGSVSATLAPHPHQRTEPRTPPASTRDRPVFSADGISLCTRSWCWRARYVGDVMARCNRPARVQSRTRRFARQDGGGGGLTPRCIQRWYMQRSHWLKLWRAQRRGTVHTGCGGSRGVARVDGLACSVSTPGLETLPWPAPAPRMCGWLACHHAVVVVLHFATGVLPPPPQSTSRRHPSGPRCKHGTVQRRAAKVAIPRGPPPPLCCGYAAPGGFAWVDNVDQNRRLLTFAARGL